MAVHIQLLIGILILQIYVHGAPSDIGKLEDIAKVETNDKKLDSIPQELVNNTSTTENVREKRFYNPFAYGFPPVNPVQDPNFNYRDDFTGSYGFDDPLAQIYRQVQEIAGFVRQPPNSWQGPGIPPLPIFFPVLFVPPFDCNCNSQTDQPPKQPDQPIDRGINEPTDQPGETDKTGEEVPDVSNRVKPPIDDRQNWGLFINETDENSSTQDFSRPISFDPIRANRPTVRPSPAVEHGSAQGDVTASQVPQSVEKPPQPQRPAFVRPTTFRPPSIAPGSQGSPFNTQRPVYQGRPFNTPRPVYQNRPSVSPPTPCDSAIIACCHQPILTYECFAAHGCPNISSYGSPCNNSTILSIIDRLQAYYATRNG